MGAGILPTAIYNNKLYFLFGKENKYEDSAPGFSDFGGGSDNTESYLETAIREAGEELTGFLGNETDIRRLLKTHGTYNIDYKNEGHKIYRMHIFPFAYDEKLPFYYNNNQRFLQTHLDESIIQNTKIFEKEEIRWVCVEDLKRMRPAFRSYFQNIVDLMLEQKERIDQFLRKSTKPKTIRLRKKRKNHTRRL